VSRYIDKPRWMLRVWYWQPVTTARGSTRTYEAAEVPQPARKWRTSLQASSAYAWSPVLCDMFTAKLAAVVVCASAVEAGVAACLCAYFACTV
jgi:hypothetical protein